MLLESFLYPDTIEAGCDEAGRGCLAGPVFAAAVILPADFPFEILNDSKKMSDKKRYEARKLIEEKAEAWAVAKVDPKKIDEINILNASILAMHKAVKKLDIKPEHILVDGNRFKDYPKIPHTCVIKGDGKIASIAAASILAKTYRDDFMIKLHDKFPYYSWNKHKGYPTKQHRKAIAENGPSKHHRMSFKLLADE
ncbi:MAG: ribonuclease HII [Marinifilaceae bacterium]|jgi:ribonuclease HII|nr:ribonuclease HII [Marinifilaceae bacterium]